MDRTSDFLRAFQTSLDAVPLPEALVRRYALESCLADGEQGSVWLVRRREDGGRYVLRTSRERDLRGEFELMRRLPGDLAGQTPAAVEFFQEDGTQYLVRSYLPGRSLAEAWEEEARTEEQCVRLGTALCALLDRLHKLSPPIIHRDVKPENILLLPDGSPGLIDFGIARDYDPRRDSDTACMGTRSTAAPEQYGFAQSDQRTDLYALGVTLRWMVTGSYRPEDLETAGCSGGMKRFLRKAAAFDPADRYPTAQAMGAALARLERPPGKRLRLGILVCLSAVLLAFCGAFAAGRRPVEFGSPLLEQAVRMELDMPEGPVTRKDLERVRRLAVVGTEAMDEERQFRCRLCIYLDGEPQYDAPRGDISDISLLADMPNLATLYLCRQEIVSFSALEGLPLRELYLTDNQIGDLSPLEQLPDLEVLYIGANPAADYTPISALKRLRELNLDAWEMHGPESLEPLKGLPVELLSLGNLFPQDGDWSCLGTMENLHTLWLWDPLWAATAALEDCGGLRSLNLGNYREADLSRLPAMPWLHSLSIFNRLPSIEGVQKQEGLYWLNLCNLEDLDLAPAASLRQLKEMSFYNVQVRSYAPLSETAALERIIVDTEEVRTAVEADCPGHGFDLLFSN